VGLLGFSNATHRSSFLAVAVFTAVRSAAKRQKLREIDTEVRHATVASSPKLTFVQEQHSVVSEADFPRAGSRSAADEGDSGSRVVRRSNVSTPASTSFPN